MCSSSVPDEAVEINNAVGNATACRHELGDVSRIEARRLRHDHALVESESVSGCRGSNGREGLSESSTAGLANRGLNDLVIG